MTKHTYTPPCAEALIVRVEAAWLNGSIKDYGTDNSDSDFFEGEGE